MAVTSVRLNQKEEKLLKLLKDYYNCDASSLLKRSLYELYEDLKDKEIIEQFEKKEKNHKSQFVTIDDLM
jgi:hypothetical protein